MSGSHSPYEIRYPNRFKIYPINLNDKKQNTVNAYDNSVVYSDYILDTIIDYLQKNSPKDFYFNYSSDHGESVGENNRFGHGLLFKRAMVVPFIYSTNTVYNPFKNLKIITELTISEAIAKNMGYDINLTSQLTNYVTGSDITGSAGYAIVDFNGSNIIKLLKKN